MYQPLSSSHKVVKFGETIFVGSENQCDDFATFNANGGPDCGVLKNG